MYTFLFHFSDGNEVTIPHVEKISYLSGSKVELSGEEISQHEFPLKSTYHLFSSELCATVNGANLDLAWVFIKKED